jgi:hypothetical protein
MSWFRAIDVGKSLVFNPKVTPDPEDAKRLDEKFKQVVRQTDRDVPRRPLRIVAPPKRSTNS